MSHIFVPATSAEDWKQFLREPDKQWKTGYSAKALAYSWQSADGFPVEVYDLFASSRFERFSSLEMLAAFPEYMVDLPGGGHGSQNDLFVVARDLEGQLVSMTVEGKVSESFGPTLAQWAKVSTPGKQERLTYLLSQLGLTGPLPGSIRYQLLHRTASAVIMAQRFNAQSAVMLVHSFSQSHDCLEDYLHFLALFGIEAGPQELVNLGRIGEIELFCGWVTGNSIFLSI